MPELMPEAIRFCPKGICPGSLFPDGNFRYQEGQALWVTEPGDQNIEPVCKDVAWQVTVPVAKCDTCHRSFYPDPYGGWETPILTTGGYL